MSKRDYYEVLGVDRNASIDDIKRLAEPDCAKLEGAISGRALYDGRLDAGEALGLINKNREIA